MVVVGLVQFYPWAESTGATGSLVGWLSATVFTNLSVGAGRGDQGRLRAKQIRLMAGSGRAWFGVSWWLGIVLVLGPAFIVFKTTAGVTEG